MRYFIFNNVFLVVSFLRAITYFTCHDTDKFLPMVSIYELYLSNQHAAHYLFPAIAYGNNVFF
ncbi:hypothetical protein PF008_g18952 [Phytophthora fragariae]|uniref:Uncharacterized protein n=1 Tax=Phytophthora fragariae TaxID=53985 RepID=A0A6G0R3T8_9STRA|nr:hypothetical protein PF008_g18952 [Phytophthora fragariae]